MAMGSMNFIITNILDGILYGKRHRKSLLVPHFGLKTILPEVRDSSHWFIFMVRCGKVDILVVADRVSLTGSPYFELTCFPVLPARIAR